MGWFSSNIMFSPKPSAFAVASLFIIARGMGFCYSLYKNKTTRTFEHR